MLPRRMRASRLPFNLAAVPLALLALAGCVPRSAPPLPAPVPQPRPVPLPPAPPLPAPPATDWETGPLSPGDWSYRPSSNTPLATFQSNAIGFTIRCQQGRAVWLSVSGAQADALVIHTSFGIRRLPAERVHLNELLAQLQPTDPLLEQMAFSRGRFQVATENGPLLVVPAWPELARVIEDCRGQ